MSIRLLIAHFTANEIHSLDVRNAELGALSVQLDTGTLASGTMALRGGTTAIQENIMHTHPATGVHTAVAISGAGSTLGIHPGLNFRCEKVELELTGASTPTIFASLVVEPRR